MPKNGITDQQAFALDRLINPTRTAEGPTLPPRVAGSSRVPTVSGLKVLKKEVFMGGTVFTLAWESPTETIFIDHYNIFVTGLFQNNQAPVGPYTVPASPAAIRLVADGASVLTFFVQTVLNNGLTSSFDLSPSATATIDAPQLVLSSGGDFTGTLPVSHGGTGATVYAAGSIPYSNGTILTEDNVNLFWDSTNKNILVRGRPVPQILFTQTADKTIANTATETTLFSTGVGSLTLPATFFIAGRTVRLNIRGYLATVGAAQTVIFKLKLGSTALITTGTLTLPSTVVDDYFSATALITCRTTGVSGSVVAHGEVFFGQVATDNAGVYPLVNTSATTIDTTGTNVLDLTWKWGAADPANTVTSQISVVEAIN